MNHEYSENGLVQDAAGHQLEQELAWEVAYAHNNEQSGEKGTFGRKSDKEILLVQCFREALHRLNPWITEIQIAEVKSNLKDHLKTAVC